MFFSSLIHYMMYVITTIMHILSHLIQVQFLHPVVKPKHNLSCTLANNSFLDILTSKLLTEAQSNDVGQRWINLPILAHCRSTSR